MPPGKQQQSNTMLYTLIAFVGLFIIATVIAVIFYVKSEEHGKNADKLQSQINELATTSEQSRIGELIGTKQGRKSWLGTMTGYLDQTITLITGGVPQPTSAEVKVSTANRKVKDTLELLAQQHLDVKNVPSKAPNNEFVKLLVTQQFSAATENFDANMKDALPAEKLEETWGLTISQMGPFKQQIGLRTGKELDYDIAFITCEFEKGHLDIKVVYNDEKQIAGLSFIPTPPEVLESYQQTTELVTQQQPYIEIDDPDTIGLVRVIEKLKIKLDNTTKAVIALQGQFKQLQQRYDDDMEGSFEKEKTLLAEKEKYQQQVNKIGQDYKDLEELLRKNTDEQVQSLRSQLMEERENLKTTNQELLKTQAELEMAQERMKSALEKLQEVKPLPDREVAAFKPDGEVILVDDQAKVVHLNIGSLDRVYQGLTFSVYHRNAAITKDGKGKAEVEVFDIAKNYSAARIIRSEINSPILEGDIVANLIWDSSKENVFVIAGEFDVDNNGGIDEDAVDKIQALIEKWGGRVADTVSIETDFLVLGLPPKVLRKPTSEELEINPAAMQKYNDSVRKYDHYKEIQNLAQALWLPVFNYERFLYFIGYKERASTAGAFSQY